MKKVILIPIILLFFSAYQPIFSQTAQDQKVLEELIEEIAASSDEELDYAQLFDDLLPYMEEPLNLNVATRDQLEQFQFLNDFQIEAIFEYRENAGSMSTIYELQLLSDFTMKDILRILPFVTVAPSGETQPLNLKRALKYGRSNLFLRTQFVLQEQKGYTAISDAELEKKPNARYMGDRFKQYTRYKFQFKDRIKFGFTAEKDPGEEFFKGTQKQGFDYYTAHLELNRIWKFKTIVVGDYQVKFGQGLVMSSGLGGKKSSYVMNINRKYRGLKKYSSTDENKFMRGTGATVRLGDFDITGFVSYKNIDGNVTSLDSLSDTDIPTEVSSFQITGMHRKPNEYADRKVISEFVSGGNLLWNYKKIKIGGSFIAHKFGAELNKNTKPYSQFDFQGNSNMNFSVDYQAALHNFFFFGEEAMSQNGSLAILNGVLVKLAPQISLSALHRHYQVGYQAYYGSAFAEGSRSQNEKGLYLGAEIHPIRNWTISTYFDTYKFPWLRFSATSPSAGNDFFIETAYNTSRYLNMYVRFKQETKFENTSGDITGVNTLDAVTKRQFRYHTSYSLSRTVKMKSRIEFTRYNKGIQEAEHGFVLYQDVAYTPQTFPLTLNFRLAFFDAPYNARIYAYENDILYGFSIPAYSSRGLRTYMTLKYTIIENRVDMWLRYAQFHYVDKQTIGSSLDKIDGPNKSEIKIQFRIKF